jgi:hypothetical protein
MQSESSTCQCFATGCGNERQSGRQVGVTPLSRTARSDGKAGEKRFFGMQLALVGVRIDLEQGQRSSQFLALGEGRGPVAVVAFTVEAQTLAGEQAVGDRGDGDF